MTYIILNRSKWRVFEAIAIVLKMAFESSESHHFLYEYFTIY